MIVKFLSEPHTKDEIKQHLNDAFNKNLIDKQVSNSTLDGDIRYLIRNDQIRRAETEELKKLRKNVKYESSETFVDRRKAYYIANKSEILNFTSDVVNKIDDYYKTGKTVNDDDLRNFFEVITKTQGITSLKIPEEKRFNLLVKLLIITKKQTPDTYYDLNTLMKDLKLTMIVDVKRIIYLGELIEIQKYIIKYQEINSEKDKTTSSEKLDKNFDFENEDFIEANGILIKYIEDEINRIITKSKKILDKNINDEFKSFLKEILNGFYLNDEIVPYITFKNNLLKKLEKLIDQYKKSLSEELKNIIIQYNNVKFKKDRSFLSNPFKKRDLKSELDKLMNKIENLNETIQNLDNFDRFFPSIFIDVFEDINYLLFYLEILLFANPSKFCESLKTIVNDHDLNSFYFDTYYLKYFVNFSDIIKYYDYDFNVILILFNPLYAVFQFFIEYIFFNESKNFDKVNNYFDMINKFYDIINKYLDEIIKNYCISYFYEKLSLFSREKNYSMMKLINIILKL